MAITRPKKDRKESKSQPVGKNKKNTKKTKEENNKELSRDIAWISFWDWRPPIFDTVEEMQSKIIEYFNSEASKRSFFTKDWLEIKVPHPTITWLSLWLGFSSRSTFYNYWQREEFLYTIEKARTFIENQYEKMLADNPTGAIFALKNFWWKDTQTIEWEMTNNNKSVSVTYEAWKYENLWEDGEPIEIKKPKKTVKTKKLKK